MAAGPLIWKKPTCLRTIHHLPFDGRAGRVLPLRVVRRNAACLAAPERWPSRPGVVPGDVRNLLLSARRESARYRGSTSVWHEPLQDGPIRYGVGAAGGDGFSRASSIATDFRGDKREEVLETPYVEVLQRVDATREVFLSPARAACRFALRPAIGSIRTGQRHAERVWHLARAAAECLPGGAPERGLPAN
jgi:hypothetical protein